jgi:tRNA/tmRNA/rRNA uracil-C5-methylase (TrmA/RlmC/RlmD family)
MDLLDELNVALDTLQEARFHVNAAGRAMIVLQTSDQEAPELEITVPASLNFLLGQYEPFNMIGDTHITHEIYGRTFRQTAGVDARHNIPQVERLLEVVTGYVKPKKRQWILDLYGGIGTFAAFIAPYAQRVTYVDSYPPAATDAEFNLDDLPNVDIVEGRVDAVLSDIPMDEYHAAVLDPPAQGLNRRALEELARLKLPTLVYVGQNVTTFARDMGALVHDAGYQLVEVQPLDFAPQTAAIETIACLTR